MTRSATVPAFAKLNLDLRVLHKREDGFHEIRTVFQTISLADRLSIELTPARRTSIAVAGVEIPDNLVIRAAAACLDEWRITARVEFTLTKRIPMGAGLGGGSSDAAAVLLALPVLARKVLPPERAIAIGRGLGSDVPFFLVGGTAAGTGRGTELFPLTELPARPGLLIAPGIHVSTADAYRDLGRTITPASGGVEAFQAFLAEGDFRHGVNDFEASVFARHPSLTALRQKMERLGGDPARMSGSGSSIYGLFASKENALRAGKSFSDVDVFPFTLVSRARYRSAWWRALQSAGTLRVWPPRHSPRAGKPNAQ